MIDLKDVYLKYPNGNTALANINLKVSAGELVCITGPSGSGKTSLLKLIIGTVKPTEGIINIFGIQGKTSSHNKRKIRTLIGPVFQEFRLINSRTSLENVLLAMRFLKLTRNEMHKNSVEALKKVGLEKKINTNIDHLSWGEMQRVAIARAIARKPRLILADEPTGNLDRENAEKIFDILSSLKDDNISVVIATHATHLIEHIKSNRHLYINNGIITNYEPGQVQT